MIKINTNFLFLTFICLRPGQKLTRITLLTETGKFWPDLFLEYKDELSLYILFDYTLSNTSLTDEA